MIDDTETERLIDGVIRREGGYVDHPADRGGPTRYGVTQAALSRHLGRPASREDVKTLSIETAREIYQLEYVTAPRFDRLPGLVAEFVIDTGVHSGPRTAAKMLQRVLNEAGFGPLDVDGRAWALTRRAAEKATEAMGDYLLAALILERLRFLRALIAADPSQRAFEKGWINRLKSFWPEGVGDEAAQW